ncbi:uncharacterized protein LOC106088011 [Stomoxys calcitrans]|uniref:uncharacterized protein LOC106088011 n=1 Tax=Stomoxys calcitrans TaxID=35570 RepID=UPI0027E35D7E|nr:uncharacterized protein LOC106088011 [Stomoxys calcitrans]
MVSQQQGMVDIRLDSPRTPNPYSVQTPLFEGSESQNRPWPSAKSQDDGKPYVRFYAVGPKSRDIICPLCKEKSESVTVMHSDLVDRLNCLMSCLSCCFPIFAISCLYTMCFQGSFSSKRKCCRKCGGHLGLYTRPM